MSVQTRSYTAAPAKGPPDDVRPRSVARWLLVGAALVVIVAGFAGVDRWFYEHVSLVLNNEDRPLDRTFYTVTKPFWLLCRYAFGHVLGALAIGGVVVALQPKRWRTVATALVVVAVVAFLANIAQGAIGRVRPNQAPSHLTFVPPFSELLTKERVCFPSGEAATAFALAYMLSQLLPRYRPAFFAAATLAAVARLVNGAHYPSDVAAGALFGTLVARGLLALIGRYRPQLFEPGSAQL